ILPRDNPDEPPVASGSSVAYSISARTEHPDVAAAFLNYMSSAEAGQIAIDTGFMPVDTDAGAAAEGTLGEVAEAFAPVAENDNIVPFPDFAAPGMIDQLTAGIQGIISDQMEPDQFLASMQETWTSYHGWPGYDRGGAPRESPGPHPLAALEQCDQATADQGAGLPGPGAADLHR